MAEAILEVAHLRKSFGSRTVLDDISFEIREGEILGLMGESGGGKSTILKLINGLERADSGVVRFEGRELTNLPESKLAAVRTRIGFVFQNGALFDSLTVAENLSYPLIRHTDLDEEEIAARVAMRLKVVGLEGTDDLYPYELSGGMLKRAGLIRATMLEPRLVLFDEPTAGLDPFNVRNFIDKVREFKVTRGLSGIFVSHEASVVLAISDEVAILWKGRIHARGRPWEMRRSDDPVVRSFVRPRYVDREGGPPQRAKGHRPMENDDEQAS